MRLLHEAMDGQAQSAAPADGGELIEFVCSENQKFDQYLREI
jgi:hypothetical protein